MIRAETEVGNKLSAGLLLDKGLFGFSGQYSAYFSGPCQIT
jgi:hypothetical protein